MKNTNLYHLGIDASTMDFEKAFGNIKHGIGESSTSVMLYELFKLLKFAKCVDPLIIRIGTCGGLGLDPGTVVITQKAYDGFLREFLSIVVQTIHV
ncbi:uridine phosphorylase 1-like [Octopus sinensis]|uniref:Uridine phosphorylase 1-like n=1 Tax=Octopus sinensis TaxID=2607531 RepID=A0A6P7U6F8_9MOLL|nr:uridine phosphorylase 1-like [Octopus sinensis]